MGPNLPPQHVFGWLKEELSDPAQPKVGANMLYDLEALHYEGVQVAGPIYDVQVAEPLLDETRLSYALEILAKDWLREGKRQTVMVQWLKAAFGDEGNIKKHIYRAPASIVGPYAESDVDLPLRLFELQRKQLEEEGLWDLFIMESKLIPMLLQMRLRGVPIDIQHAEQLLSKMKDSYADIISDIKRIAGFEPDIWAADSLARIFDKAGVQYPRTSKTDKPSFRKEWLLHHPHPVAKLIQSARHNDKFRGTFIQGYLLDSNVNGRIHCQFHQLRTDSGGTVSGRFSSSNPNLQNIPTRTAEGKLIRQAFVAEPGREWWKFDWSQLEYRLIAHYAAATGQPGIEPIVEAYLNDPNTDYHQAVADLTGLPRSDAKNLNFGLAYGQGIDLLCQNLGVDRNEGERIMREYHARAPFIKPLMALTSRRAQQTGFIRTILGRKRRFNVWERGGNSWSDNDSNGKDYVSENNRGQFANAVSEEILRRIGWTEEQLNDWDLRSPDNPKYVNAMKNAGYRRAFLHKTLNSLTQGSNADLMKKAMVDVWESGVCDVIGVPYLTVHDELDGDMEKGNPKHEEAIREIQHIMTNVVQLKVPLMADKKVGKNWGILE